jgi:hypothetical protein
MAYISQADKKELAPAIKAVLKKYGMKGTISIRNHSSLVVTVKSGKLPFPEDHIQVNTYWIDSNYKGKQKAFLNELLSAMMGDKWYDKSDIMTDYFNTAYYLDINIGRWDRPYELTA